jgi:hypothetical protein
LGASKSCGCIQSPPKGDPQKSFVQHFVRKFCSEEVEIPTGGGLFHNATSHRGLENPKFVSRLKYPNWRPRNKSHLPNVYLLGRAMRW